MSFGQHFLDTVASLPKISLPFTLADVFGTDVELNAINFFNPEITSRDQIAPRSLPIMRLEEALLFTFGYLLMVFFGTLLMKTDKPQPEQKKGVTIWMHISSVISPKDISRSTAVFNLTLAICMLAYNAFQVVLCGYMCYSAIAEALNKNYVFVCNDFKLSEDGMAKVVHIFYLSKILDFMDTFFMIIRRKWRQVSFLHVYHHTSIFLVYWVNMNSGYDGDVYFTVVLNSFIHFIMYFYYGCSALGIKVPVFIKMMITNSQLTQFVCMLAQGAYSLTFGCPYPKNIVIMYILYLFTMLYLFMDFHKKTYKTNDEENDQKKKE
eukprot:m.84940 g.84940  ORF g.84940 m.84940 type:complete len:322 (-) comp12176_c1_seq1:1522-2487(-)